MLKFVLKKETPMCSLQLKTKQNKNYFNVWIYAIVWMQKAPNPSSVSHSEKKMYLSTYT